VRVVRICDMTPMTLPDRVLRHPAGLPSMSARARYRSKNREGGKDRDRYHLVHFPKRNLICGVPALKVDHTASGG